MRTLILLLLIVAVLSPAVASATDVQGDVWGTWTKENSPYNVIGEVRVPPGSTLVIEPGVLVDFQGHYKFIVDSLATLLAIGTETDSIYFTTEDTATGWHGIRFLYADTACQITYCRLEYGKAFDPWPDNLGGAVYCYYSSPTITNNTIEANSANQGGGIFCDTLSSTLIEGNSIVSNRATSISWAWGGGICCTGSSPEIRNNSITGNAATATLARGGGISCRESSPTIEGNSMNGNFAKGSQVGSGGAISCYQSGPTITSNLVTDNWAMSLAMGWVGGGGIACEDSSDPYISDNIISGNSADSVGGGGISCYGNSNAEIVYNAITENRGSWQGGGILCVGSCPVIIGNSISGNSGSGIYCDGASPTISDNNICHNTAGSGAGIVCYRDSSPTINRNQISQNLAPYIFSQGGGVYCYESSPRIDSNSITENVAAYAGGGIYCRESSSIITNNTIRANSSGERGGGIACTHESNDTIAYNTISLNSASLGGGIFCFYHSSPTITDVTLNRNSASEKGGGLYCLDECNPLVINTILWADTARTGPEIYLEENSNPIVSYSDIQGGWSGVGNIDADPLFVGPERQDFHLRWHSRCIDAGVPDSLDPDGTCSDIGAFYFNQDVDGIVELCPYNTPIIIPPEGGDIMYDGWVFNFLGHPGRADIWTYAFVPEVGRYGPINLYENIRIPPDTLGRNGISQHVPGIGPQGDYVFVAYVGQYPTTIIDSSYFYFAKTGSIPGGRDGWFGSNAWLNHITLTEGNLPSHYDLSQNYPNPFNATTSINYQLPVDSRVKLEVYNVLGEKVVTLVDENKEAGYRSVIWDASELSSGLYFYKLTAGDYTETKRMMLVK